MGLLEISRAAKRSSPVFIIGEESPTGRGSSLLYTQVTTTTKNWRDYISERDANRVEELLDPELAQFGYQSAVR